MICLKAGLPSRGTKDRLDEWAKRNLRKINNVKFNPCQQEWLGSDWLGRISAEKAPWVLVDSKMNVSQQCVLVNTILNCINRSNGWYTDGRDYPHLYLALVSSMSSLRLTKRNGLWEEIDKLEWFWQMVPKVVGTGALALGGEAEEAGLVQPREKSFRGG